MIIGIPIPYTEKQYYLNQNYINWIQNSGYDSVLILPNTPQKILNLVDGFIIPGGVDTDPTLFNESNYNSVECNPSLDLFQIKIIDYAIEKKLSIFGVCRGHQLIYRYFKKKFPNDELLSKMFYLQDIKGHQEKVYAKLVHEVCHFTSGNLLKVNSLHHQGVLIPSENAHLISDLVKIEYLSNHNMEKNILLVEGLFYDKYKIRTVQWHPEGLNQIELLKDFFIR
jgi:putative glutamine amidotransferase